MLSLWWEYPRMGRPSLFWIRALLSSISPLVLWLGAGLERGTWSRFLSLGQTSLSYLEGWRDNRVVTTNSSSQTNGRADSRFAPSQWETLLHSNTVSHWLGASLDSGSGRFENFFLEIVHWWLSLDIAYDNSTLVQVMACCLMAPSHYLSHCWPRSLCHQMASQGHYELRRGAIHVLHKGY